jgi:putative spermidine/putrescine transport system permease protein
MKNKWLAIFSSVVYSFLLFPLVIITVAGFSKEEYLKFPPTGFSLRWMANIFQVEMFMKAFIISLELAVIGTMIAFVVGLPAAYGLSRCEFKGKNLLKGLFMSPVIVPGIVLGFALLKLLIVQYGMPVFPSLLLGHTIIILPYIIRVIS